MPSLCWTCTSSYESSVSFESGKRTPNNSFSVSFPVLECFFLVTTNNYNTFTNLHVLQITTAVNNCYFFATHCLIATSNTGGSFHCFHVQGLLSTLLRYVYICTWNNFKLKFHAVAIFKQCIVAFWYNQEIRENVKDILVSSIIPSLLENLWNELTKNYVFKCIVGDACSCVL
jgi:hypothetical protein